VHKRARLHLLYEFVATQRRLPGLTDACRGVGVGQWAEQCRQLHHQGALDGDLAAALASIPGWSWQPQVPELSVHFEASLAQLRTYAQHHGVPPLRGAANRAANDASSGQQQQLPPEHDTPAAAALRKRVCRVAGLLAGVLGLGC
jgi:hypothetical protein